MKTIFFAIFLIISQVSCSNNSVTERGINTKTDSARLIYKKGDCLVFKLDSLTYGVGIVTDFSKDEGGTWYGIVYTDYVSTTKPKFDSVKYHRVFGRRVESSLNERGYEIMLDGEFLKDSTMSTGDNFILLGNLPLNDKAKLGTYGASNKLSDLVRAFRYGQARRLSPPDDYREQIKKSEKFRPEEYFELSEFLD